MSNNHNTVFVNATEARRRTRDSSLILNEIRSLEANVLTQIDAGNLSVSVSSGTTITSGVSYYQAYNGVTTDANKTDQINVVKKHFTDLGYTVSITNNATTGNTLIWTITW